MRTSTPLRRTVSTSGFILPIVLLVAFVGVLIGLGRLLLFRYQCQQRFSRQRELEHISATRSALRFLEANPLAQPAVLHYEGMHGRAYDLTVQPTSPLYVSAWPGEPWDSYAGQGDVEWIADGVRMCASADDAECVRVWHDLALGESWRHSDFGRRYWFKPTDVEEGSAISLYLFSQQNGPRNLPGEVGEPWIRLKQNNVFAPNNVELSYWDGTLASQTTTVATASKNNLSHALGVQLSDCSATLFQWATGEGFYLEEETHILSDWVTDHFGNIRLCLVVERGGGGQAITNTLSFVRVDPSFEYETRLRWQDKGVQREEVSTYVHCRPTGRGKWQAITYDTHGTEAK